jgi:hypothetical protein
MRSALFALANLNAKLQVYNEETGVIVATISKRLGTSKQDVIIKVRRFDQTSILEVEAPDPERVQQLLTQISAYITDGAGRVQADATINWVDLTRQKESREKRRQLVNRAKGLIPGVSSGSEETLPAVVDSQGPETAVVLDSQGNEIVPVDSDTSELPPPIPDNPGVLVKNYQDKVIELKVDPAVFADRTAYLEICQACNATVMRGSKYCSSCGRPITLEAVQPELRNAAGKAARASLQAGLVAVLAILVPFIVLLVPELISGTADSLSFLQQINQSLTPIRLTLAALLGVLPAMLFGWWAISQARKAGWYQNLNAMFDEPGRLRSTIGRVLGWVAIYVSAAWILFILVALFAG